MRLAASLLLLLLIGSAIAVLRLSPVSYATQDRAAVAASSSRAHTTGTDELGRDRTLRIAAALLLGLAGACGASAIASGLALGLGSLAAICPAWASRIFLYCGDLFLTLPWIFLLMLVRSALPLNLPPLQSGLVTFLLLAVLGAPAFLRLNFVRTSSLLRADWLFHAHATGLHHWQLGRQMLPHLRPLLWSQFLLYVPACVIAEANLGALGLGVGEPVPSWGTMLAGLQSASLISSSHLIYLPMLVLVLVLVALELMVFGENS